MKKIYLFCMAFAITIVCCGQTIFINEIHYDNTGGDLNEGFEIAGPAGTSLSGFQIRLYNGDGGGYYDSIVHLYGTIPNLENNRGVKWFSGFTIQNGPKDGLALIDNLGNVIQFLSYGGIITATEGVANGMTSVNIGVIENESTPVGYSLQLVGEGSNYSDFTWSGPSVATRGQINNSQTLPVTENQISNFKMFPNPVQNGIFSITTSSFISKKIELYSINGQLVLSQYVNSNQPINVSVITKGIYILKVEEEGKISTRKLVIN